MSLDDVEPFPELHDFGPSTRSNNYTTHGKVRRRKSSALGGELPGDSDVAAFATLVTPPVTPTTETPRPLGRRSKRRTLRRALAKSKRMCIRHTWLVPLIVSLTIAALYFINPVPSNPFSACLFLSYPLPIAPDADEPIQYGKGARDFAFVAFYTVVLSFTREFIMQRIIRPIALYNGIRTRAKQARFMEQFYTALYFAVFGPFGLYVMRRTPIWFFNTTAMYEDFPHRTHEAVFKAYYLLQASYWSQQMIVLLLMLEKPRKDFKELVAHHFITLALIWCSYRFHFTYMGIAVYITMDISDFFLATSKVLNYLDSPIVAPFFSIFMGVWFYLRHWVNLRILYSIITEMPHVGDFTLNWETQQYKCWISQYISFALLAALQAVNLFWWFYICRIAWRIVFLNVVEDERSEDEEEDDEKDGARMEGRENGMKGTPNAAPRLLVNGEEPTPLEQAVNGELNGSSRLRERRAQK